MFSGTGQRPSCAQIWVCGRKGHGYVHSGDRQGENLARETSGNILARGVRRESILVDRSREKEEGGRGGRPESDVAAPTAAGRHVSHGSPKK